MKRSLRQFSETCSGHFRGFFLSALLAAGTIVATLTLTQVAHAELVRKELEYHLGGRDYVGYLVFDNAEKSARPGVLVAHNWMGITQDTRDHADQLAKMGYVAFAADIYGKGIRPKNAQEAGSLAGGLKKDRLIIRMRMQEALKVLREQPTVNPQRLAVIGFCFGGTAALELARTGAELKSLVSFHGGLDSPKPEDGKRIKAKLLILHGADDPFESAQDFAAFQSELRNAKLDWQLVQYGNAVHSFTEKEAGNDNSKGAAYNELADKRSAVAMQNFLKETL